MVVIPVKMFTKPPFSFTQTLCVGSPVGKRSVKSQQQLPSERKRLHTCFSLQKETCLVSWYKTKSSLRKPKTPAKIVKKFSKTSYTLSWFMTGKADEFWKIKPLILVNMLTKKNKKSQSSLFFVQSSSMKTWDPKWSHGVKNQHHGNSLIF